LVLIDRKATSSQRIVFSMAWKASGYQVDVFTARADGSDLVQVTRHAGQR